MQERRLHGPKGRAKRRRPKDDSKIKVFAPPLGNGNEELIISPTAFLEYRRQHPMPSVGQFKAPKIAHTITTADILKKTFRGQSPQTTQEPIDANWTIGTIILAGRADSGQWGVGGIGERWWGHGESGGLRGR